MPTTPVEKLLPILQEHYKPREDGWLWMVFYADGDENGVVHEVTGSYDEFGDGENAARSLAEVINGVGADNVFLALCRAGGQPRESDRELWRRLRTLVDAAVLDDLVVFNKTAAWSMREEDAAAA
jgi:hypothetical protein